MNDNSDQLLQAPSFWILTKYYQLEKSLEETNAKYELAHSIDKIYKFLWDDYADWYIEYLKTSHQSELYFAKNLFKQFVITVSPYCPFESQTIWSQFFKEDYLLSKTTKDFEWSKKALNIYFETSDYQNLENSNLYKEFAKIIHFIKSVRSLRGLFAIDVNTTIDVYTEAEFLYTYTDFLKLICKVNLNKEKAQNLYQIQEIDYKYQIDIKSYIKDIESEKNRTQKNIESLLKQIQNLEKQLSNQGFVQNADPETISEKHSQLQQRQVELNQQQQKIIFLEQ
jgi:valyl-tRNA synthetase